MYMNGTIVCMCQKLYRGSRDLYFVPFSPCTAMAEILCAICQDVVDQHAEQEPALHRLDVVSCVTSDTVACDTISATLSMCSATMSLCSATPVACHVLCARMSSEAVAYTATTSLTDIYNVRAKYTATMSLITIAIQCCVSSGVGRSVDLRPRVSHRMPQRPPRDGRIDAEHLTVSYMQDRRSSR